MASGSLQEKTENITGHLNVSSDLPMETDIPLAVLSKAAYTQYETNDVKSAQKVLDEYNIGFNVVEDLTEPEYITAINQDEKKIVVAFRGTDSTLKNIYDDIADLQIAIGLAETPVLSYIPSRFSTGEAIYNKVKKMYPDYQISLTGHSLGGSVAHYIGDKYNEKSVVFNAGSTPVELYTNKILGNKPSKTKFYITDTLDLISNSSIITENKKNINIIKTKDYNKKYLLGSHSIDNYLPQVREKMNPIINKMYPKQEKAIKSNLNKVAPEPFIYSVCELNPKKCY
jgi:predicted esterase YcpF (UPF0227 family)